MKHIFVLSVVFLMSLSVATAQTTTSQGQVKHVVVFKYKTTATQQQIMEVTSAFAGLKTKIPGIVSLEYGVNNSPENLNKGFTHIYLVTFDGIASRNAYLIHPDHKKFVELLGKLAVLDEPFVVDFEVNK